MRLRFLIPCQNSKTTYSLLSEPKTWIILWHCSGQPSWYWQSIQFLCKQFQQKPSMAGIICKHLQRKPSTAGTFRNPRRRRRYAYAEKSSSFSEPASLVSESPKIPFSKLIAFLDSEFPDWIFGVEVLLLYCTSSGHDNRSWVVRYWWIFKMLLILEIPLHSLCIILFICKYWIESYSDPGSKEGSGEEQGLNMLMLMDD